MDEGHTEYFLDPANPDYRQMLADLINSAQRKASVQVTYALDRPETIDVRPAAKAAAGVVPPAPPPRRPMNRPPRPWTPTRCGPPSP